MSLVDEETVPKIDSARNLTESKGRVDAVRRSVITGHTGHTLWFTGLSGCGKSTLAYAVEEELIKRGVASYVLDGDNVRMGLNRDLGFSAEDRSENVRRVGEVSRLFQDAGLVVLAAFISPYRTDREAVRALHPEGTFSEVFIDSPVEVCEERDVKGLYAKARSGEVLDFSGVSAPYEVPLAPDLYLDTTRQVGKCVDDVLRHLGY